MLPLTPGRSQDAVDVLGWGTPAVDKPVTEMLGLQRTAQKVSSASKARPAPVKAPTRTGSIWATVNVIEQAMSQTPKVKCRNCGHVFCGGISRIEQHICVNCPCETEAFCVLKETVLKKTALTEGSKRQKLQESLALVVPVSEPRVKREAGQLGIRQSLESSKAEEVDMAIAEMFYGLNIAPSKIDHALVKKAFYAMRMAPAAYTLPNRFRLGYDLLDSTTASLKAEQRPVRENMLKHGGTLISDGWDDITNSHLINILIGVSGGAFFEGTYKLMSEDSEDATAVAKLLNDHIYRIGPTTVVQVVTDTCSVMKAAWVIIQKEFPWITCTCCGPHVLSLELLDMGKIPEVNAVITKVGKVLSRFWGKTRWPRAKLREVTAVNHSQSIGLYKAKLTRCAAEQLPPPTAPPAGGDLCGVCVTSMSPLDRLPRLRFAGKVREMGRMLRVKADLQQIVISAEYAKQKFKAKEGDLPEEEEAESGAAARPASRSTVLGANDPVKLILMDEAGFWTPLVNALKIMTPVVQFLRLMDGDAPAMGKIYPRVVKIRKAIEASSVSWKAAALAIHEKRWAYLKSEMHLAGYALDPEFIDDDMTEEVQNALIAVTERNVLRLKVAELLRAGSLQDAKELTTDSDSVQEGVSTAMTELAKYQGREGVFGKAFVQANAKTFAPSKWWEQYGKGTPNLASVACSVLAQPVCASAAERNWSIYGSIKTDKRTRLKHVHQARDCGQACLLP